MADKNEIDFPYEMRDVEPQQAEALMKLFTGERTGFVLVGPKKYFMPHKYRKEAAKIYNMKVRPSDLFVMSYPRSGTTWTQELVWLVAKDLDYEGAAATPLTDRFPFLEFTCFFHPELEAEFRRENKDNPLHLQYLDTVSSPAREYLDAAPSPRFVKTHLPLSLLPPTLLDTGRVVYVARDPRDVAVSFFHLNKSIRTQGYVSDFKTYWKYFKDGLHHWTPYFEQVKEAWEARYHPHMLFLFYEDLSSDLPAAVRRVAKFLGKDYSEEQVAKLCSHLSIDNFRNNASVNYDLIKELGIMHAHNFVRKGKSGGWRDYFDDEMAAEAREWMREQLRGTDLRFPHINDQELGLA